MRRLKVQQTLRRIQQRTEQHPAKAGKLKNKPTMSEKGGELWLIYGADINLIQTQKLSDGNCICRKNCRKKGFKSYDYVHSNLPGVKAHLAQVERGTKLWEHYFIPREKQRIRAKN